MNTMAADGSASSDVIESVGNVTSQNPEVGYMTVIVNNLDYYLVPVVIGAGLLGNTLSFMVFVFTNLKTLSSSVYLAALSISDSGFLICVFFSWVINHDVGIYHEQGWCQTFVYLTYVFSFLSVWYVVAFTIERWIVVLFPFKRGDMCTVKKANIVVVSLAIFGFAAYNFGIWTPVSVYVTMSNGTETDGPYCTILDEYRHLISILNNVDTVVTLILPSCVITVLNLQIIRAVTRINKDRHQVLYSHATVGRQPGSPNSRAISPKSQHQNKTQSPPSPCPGQSQEIYAKNFLSKTRSGSSKGSSSPSIKARHQTAHNAAGQNRVTKMLLVVSSIFLLLNLPAHTIRIYFFIAAFVNPAYRPPTIMLSLQRLFTYLYYVNFAINFFLYSLCGNNFRKSLRHLIHRPIMALKKKFCSFRMMRGRQSDSTREEMSLVYKRQADSVVSYNNGRTSLTTV